MLEGYRVESEIYRGRRRVVRRVVREHDHVRLILKSLLVEAATDEDVAAAKREFDVLSALSVEGVPRVYGLLADATGFHLLLEDKQGVTLA